MVLTAKAPIRRYDVFAAYSMLDALDDGMKPAEAKRYGVWLATVVAARKFHKRAGQSPSAIAGSGYGRTDFLGLIAEDYDERIRTRMGAAFHDRVFLPTVKRLRAAGHAYVEIRDAVRRDWLPG